MSVSLYMDENVHGAITTGLRQREVDVLKTNLRNLSIPSQAILTIAKIQNVASKF